MTHKQINILLLTFVVLFLSFALYQGRNIYKHNHPNVKPGQIWVRNAKDPFKPKSDTIHILEVKGDYSRYSIRDTVDSDRNFWVVYNAKLFKDVE